MLKIVTKIKSFYGHTVEEGKKCTWPNKGELVESTLVIIVSIALLAITVGALDKVFSSSVSAIIGG
jgi:preprotein translocase subunit SecE